MALIKKTNADFATFDNSYIKIDNIVWRDENPDIMVTVNTYVNKTNRVAGKLPITQNIYMVNIPIDGITISKVYNKLKLLNDFKDALDDL